MSAPPPQFKLAKRPPKSNSGGILPVPALETQKNSRNNDRNGVASSHRKGDSTSSQAPAVRLKLVLRRLAPGLTQTEFDAVLGDDWKPGSGKVDWIVYKPGKVSKDPAKPSKPARAYLHLTHQSHINPLRDLVRKSTFADARNTTKDPALLGPPSLEFAPHQRVPASGRAKPRPDNKQGTIDQDNEFIAFLAELTTPVAKTKAENEGIAKEGKPTTTPLIEHLREKKAAKEKGLTVKTSKHARHDSKDSNDVLSDRSSPIKTRNDPIFSRDVKGAQHTNTEHTSRNTTPNLNKDAQPSPGNAASNPGKAAPAPQPATGSIQTAPRRDRGNMSGVARMLQRDLGLSPGSGRRGPRRDGNAEPNKPSPLKQEETATTGQAAPGTPSSLAVSGQTARNTNPRSPRGEANTLRTNDIPILPQYTANSAEGQRRPTPGNPLSSSSTSNVAAKNPAVTSPPTGPRVVSQPPRGPPGRQPPKGAAQNESDRGLAVPRPPASSVPNPTIQGASPTSSLTSPVGNQTNATPSAPANTQHNPVTPSTTSRFPKVSPTATQAFLKHANPSQGITEPLIEEAMRAFGPVTKVEIDQRKGFAYVDFGEPEALQKAVQAGNVKVAQGSVQVLERKDRKPGPPPAAFGSPAGPPMGPRGGMMGGGVGFRGGANFGPGFRGGRGGRGRGGGPGCGMGRGGGAVGTVLAPGVAPAAAAASSNAAADGSKP